MDRLSWIRGIGNAPDAWPHARQEKPMSHRENFILRLFLVLFTVSVSVTVIPGGIVTAYGLFGEAKTSVVTEEGEERAEEVGHLVKKERSVKQDNLFNIWFVLEALILCLIYTAYGIRLPGKDTIVALKVRMDD